jgi:hypothetical protein
MSTVLISGGIPRIKEPICPFISKVLVALVACATAGDSNMSGLKLARYEGASNNRETIKMDTVMPARLRFTTKDHLGTYY